MILVANHRRSVGAGTLDLSGPGQHRQYGSSAVSVSGSMITRRHSLHDYNLGIPTCENLKN